MDRRWRHTNGTKVAVFWRRKGMGLGSDSARELKTLPLPCWNPRRILREMC